ncbi:hypothetical protein AXG93_4491s1200 [Marchantia polymorpha subsp. ruderalis]|uniref:Large ribosomal subunit protein uL3c n=3 Tax=Marchantia polymorpha TaxID=3197 RepID=A0A176WQE3_MARPO|nr:hypothetical protein AXG93_4491s1200 [Marchantia polymorpha subsp. ruderalis]
MVEPYLRREARLETADPTRRGRAFGQWLLAQYPPAGPEGRKGLPTSQRAEQSTAKQSFAAMAALASISSSLATLSLNSAAVNVSASTSAPALIPAFSGLRTGSLPLSAAKSSSDFHSVVSVTLARSSSSNGGASRGVVTMGPLEAGVGLMGTKMGMMTYFTPEGNAIPVTVIGFHEGNIVTQVKTDATDGYSAVQVGYRRVRDRKLTKPEMGHLKKVDVIPMRHLQEFRLTSVDGFEPAQRLKLDELFKEGDLIDVAGDSIGKGFAGGIKRWHFARGQRTHGSKSYRQLGSIGAGTTPGRVYPGKKMPGRLGGGRAKIRKLEIIKVDDEMHAMLIKGSVPGKPGNLLRITPAKLVGINLPK